MHLVPFGEYVPLQSVLFFAGPIIGAVAEFSSFTPGTVPVLLPVGGHVASTAICYEVIYPNLIRRFVRDGSELLTTITNDAWYGRSSAAYQHWDQASMRAIEEGRYLARAANTGISGFVDPYGRVHVEDAAVRAGAPSCRTSVSSPIARSTAGSATSSPGCRWRSPPRRFSRRGRVR